MLKLKTTLLLIIALLLISSNVKASNKEPLNTDAVSWFSSGAVFSELNNSTIVNASYYAGGNSSLRTLDLYFNIVNSDTYEVAKKYRINFYKLLKENYLAEDLERIKQSNFKKIFPKGVLRANSLFFKINKSVYRLDFEDNKYPVPQKIHEFKNEVYGVFIKNDKLFTIDKNGIHHLTDKGVKKQKLKFSKINFKVKEQSFVFNKENETGLLTLEGKEQKKAMLFNTKNRSVIKSFNHNNSIAVVDNLLLLSFVNQRGKKLGVKNIKTDKVVNELPTEVLEDSYRKDLTKVVLCNERFIALEVRGNDPSVYIVEKNTGQVKKTIKPLKDFDKKRNLLAGFEYPYLFFSKNKVSLESLFNESVPIASIRGAKPAKSSLPSKISDFNYKALLISNQDYNNGINDLEFPTKDAEQLKHILKTYYNFKSSDIIHINNAKRSDIIEALDKLTETITQKDNLLIFYAGHGVFDENLKKGYWLPIDAHANKKTNWVSNSDIRDYLSSFKSQHTLLISDACFSGSIFEFAKRNVINSDIKVTKKLLQKKSRKAMTSGLNKSVPDKSMFIKYLLKELKNNDQAYIRAGELYNEIREAVMSNTDNNPQYEIIKNANHEGGEFVFFRKQK